MEEPAAHTRVLGAQIPPILQEGKDPAWRNLQQDLQLMNQKDPSELARVRDTSLASCTCEAMYLMLRRVGCAVYPGSRHACGSAGCALHPVKIQGEGRQFLLLDCASCMTEACMSRQAWCQAHAAKTVRQQDAITGRVDEVKALSGRVIADLSRYASFVSILRLFSMCDPCHTCMPMSQQDHACAGQQQR